jgi:hypothetical protein
MTLQELEVRLVNLNVPKDAYCLTGGLPNEAYTIEKVNDKWQVYYSERGNRETLRIFDSEQEACDYFISWVGPEFIRKPGPPRSS